MTINRSLCTIGGTLLAALLGFTAFGAAQTLNTLHAFTGYRRDGATPYQGAVVIGGVVYGTTLNGGSRNQGTVFSLTPPASPGGHWTEAVYSFPGGRGGAHPYGGLVVGRGGVLYGTAGYGGTSNLGMVFSLRPPSSPGGVWTEKMVYSFGGGSDGAYPRAGVVIGRGAILYGTTASGGASTTACGTGPPGGCGTVFSLTPPASPGGVWTETVLYSFTNLNGDGAAPTSGVVIGSGGVLYGTTFTGGTSNGGMVYSLTPPASPGGMWTEKLLYDFTSGSDGYQPSGVIIGSGGVLYGTTATSGPGGGNGSVFSLTPPTSTDEPWTQTVLYNFPNSTLGSFPDAGVVIGSNGVLFGTAQYGGTSGSGTVFSLTPPVSPGGTWTATLLHDFTGGGDGAQPIAGIVIDNSGVLYSTTSYGGIMNALCSMGCGTVFSLTP